jgi:O-acetyl-ADP-ribose deacetylase (regulator of RNase III)
VIRVVVDDLAFLAVDAVLRPADEHLEPATPTAVRLDAQAGPRFLEQRRLQMPLEAGAAVVTAAGDLAAPFVLHLVVQSQVQTISRSVIRRALVSAWQQAEAWQLVRVAGPLVGAGPGGLPLEEAASLLAETWRAASETGTSARSLDIVVDQESERIVVEAVVRRSRS